MNLADLMERFATVEAAREYLEKERWPEGPECPHCGLVGEAYKITPKPRLIVEEYQSKREVAAKAKRVRKPRQGLWKCAGCRKPFTVTVGTIFEDSHIPLNKWVIAVHLMCASKKGMSAHQLHRMLGVTYKSAWFMAHRIRYAMSQEPLASQLTGFATSPLENLRPCQGPRLSLDDSGLRAFWFLPLTSARQRIGRKRLST